jgi:hypothetical protein
VRNQHLNGVSAGLSMLRSGMTMAQDFRLPVSRDAARMDMVHAVCRHKVNSHVNEQVLPTSRADGRLHRTTLTGT